MMHKTNFNLKVSQVTQASLAILDKHLILADG